MVPTLQSAVLAALQDPPGAGDAVPPPSSLENLKFPLFIGVIFLIFYFLILRPQSKQEKERRRMLGALKKHDRVVTSGGLYGTVVDVREGELTLRISENPDVRVRVTRAAVADVVTEPAAQAAEGAGKK